MIHAIYIYFIINALIAGGETERKIFWIMFLIGLPYLICDVSWSWIKGLIERYEVVTLYKLYFTNHFNDEKWIVILNDIYPKSNKYRKWIIRRISNKYNYGITK